MSDTDAPLVLFDFANPDAVEPWTSIDDRVMGGVSRSRLRHDPAGYAVFEGRVSLERNGGFASIRSAPAERGRADAQACLVEPFGDGKRYKLNLLTEDDFDGPCYQAAFTPDSGRWQTLRIPLASFRPTFRGREVAGARPLNPARIRQVGLMIAERQAGSFALAIRRISLA
jgi:NADH dehydrogenase [ubiquinone] 1 alpha subcomplex assembly factor 1